MRALLVQLDGKLPNIALMRLAHYYRERGMEVDFRRWARPEQCHRDFGPEPDVVLASAIFDRTKPVVEELRRQFPNAIVGGTGVDPAINLEQFEVGLEQDYSIYPDFHSSIGFTQRGCRLKCSFCVVPKKEGANRPELTIRDIWRGEPWPKQVHLLDNDFFGQPNWRERIGEIREGGFKVSFNQGINVRMIGQEEAEALASVDYRDDSMKVKRIYTAWDNRKDEARLFRGLNLLKAAGIKPDHVMIYMLIGYWNGPTLTDDDFYRQAKLREFGARPYPMPFVRTREIVGFQRWVIGAYDKTISWDEWCSARFEPRNLRRTQLSLECAG